MTSRSYLPPFAATVLRTIVISSMTCLSRSSPSALLLNPQTRYPHRRITSRRFLLSDFWTYSCSGLPDKSFTQVNTTIVCLVDSGPKISQTHLAAVASSVVKPLLGSPKSGVGLGPESSTQAMI
ncbi:hypothetical protein E2320_022887 [Naja naja]|nr:hypothetical protein E2320_022887 [Naja naja]